MKRIKLTESQLHKVIKESINKILKEEYGYRNLFGIEGLGMGKYSGDGILYYQGNPISEQTFNECIDYLSESCDENDDDFIRNNKDIIEKLAQHLANGDEPSDFIDALAEGIM